MCLAVVALDVSRRYPFVVAANRDEFFDRPAKRLGWWSFRPETPEILAGRDELAGGTWMGLTQAGRFGLVTNVRRPWLEDTEAPSRGTIVPRWLAGDARADLLWPQIAMGGYAPFNLLALDFRTGDGFWGTNAGGRTQRLSGGLFGLSNAGLDTPWPKLQRLKHQVTDFLKADLSPEQLIARLFSALQDPTRAEDADLPDTGIGADKERMLSSIFVRSDDGRYGTRCSTVLVAERVNRRLVTRVMERSFGPTGVLPDLRQQTLKDWPPLPEANTSPSD